MMSKIRNNCIFLMGIFLFFSCATHLTLNLKKVVAPGDWNDVSYYIGFPKNLNYEKVVLLIRGTGRFPASRDFGMGAEASMFGFSVVYPEKTYVNDEKAYYTHDNRGQRLHDLKVVIEDLIKHGTKKILLLADSEGTMLAPEIARQYSDFVCGLVCMGGSIFSFETDLRWLASQKRGMFESQEDPETLEGRLEEIYSHPDSVKKDFLGHPYAFWSSYLPYQPLDDLTGLSCPILYQNGEKDDLDIIRQEKTIQELREMGLHIKQIVYPGVGHQMKSIGKRLAKDILDWAKDNKIIAE